MWCGEEREVGGTLLLTTTAFLGTLNLILFGQDRAALHMTRTSCMLAEWSLETFCFVVFVFGVLMQQLLPLLFLVRMFLWEWASDEKRKKKFLCVCVCVCVCMHARMHVYSLHWKIWAEACISLKVSQETKYSLSKGPNQVRQAKILPGTQFRNKV